MAVKIFVTVLALQEPEITQRCFGKDCGKGIVALVSHEDLERCRALKRYAHLLTGNQTSLYGLMVMGEKCI